MTTPTKNTLQRQTLQPQKQKFSVAINSEGMQKLIATTLRDPERRNRFIAATCSAVGQNPALQKCTAASIVSCALVGEALNLSPSPTLGQYYLVPFRNKRKLPDGSYGVEDVATFIIGYKGFVQLAQRSGQYRKINVLPIKQGELVRFDPLQEEIEVVLIEDDARREQTPTAGYYAMFEYINGFRKAMYWPAEKMLAHANRFSKAFNADAYRKLQAGEIPENEMWKYSSFWYKDFDSMACKTMLRQLLSRWGMMSPEMVTAHELDEKTAVANPLGEFSAADVETEPVSEAKEAESGEEPPTDEGDEPEKAVSAPSGAPARRLKSAGGKSPSPNVGTRQDALELDSAEHEGEPL